MTLLSVTKNIKMLRGCLCAGFVVLVILFPASEAVSGDFSYDYAQADYISDTYDPGGSLAAVQGNGIGFALSLSFAPAFAVKLAVAATTFKDFQGMRVDSSKMTTLGVTAHMPVASATDVFANISAIKAEVEANDGVDKTSDKEYSAIIDLGLRQWLSDKFELEAVVSHVKLFGYTLNATTIGGRYYFRKRLSVGASYVANPVHDSLLITARMDI